MKTEIFEIAEKYFSFISFKTFVKFENGNKKFFFKSGWKEEILSGNKNVSSTGKNNITMILPGVIENSDKCMIILDFDKKNFTTDEQHKFHEEIIKNINDGRIGGEITASGGSHLFLIIPSEIIRKLKSEVYHPNFIFGINWGNSLEILIRKQCIVADNNNCGYKKGKRWINHMNTTSPKEEEILYDDVIKYFNSIDSPAIIQKCENSRTGGFYDLPEKTKAQLLYSILERLPSSCYDNYEDWFRVGTILKGALDDEDIAFFLFVNFSKKSDKYCGELNIAKLWNSWNPDKIGYGSFKFLAGDKIWKEYLKVARILAPCNLEFIDN